MNATKIQKHVEVWFDGTSNGLIDGKWIVSIETEDGSTTKGIEDDYEVAEVMVIDLAVKLGVKAFCCNRLGETTTIHPVEER